MGPGTGLDVVAKRKNLARAVNRSPVLVINVGTLHLVVPMSLSTQKFLRPPWSGLHWHNIHTKFLENQLVQKLNGVKHRLRGGLTSLFFALKKEN